MNGPEHYREAERLLAAAADHFAGQHKITAAQEVATAQVHATLAQVAERPLPMKPDGTEVGERIAAWRIQLNWTQTDLAKAMSEAGFRWHQATVYKTEIGTRPVRLDEGIALAEVFGITVTDLVGQKQEAGR